MKTTLVAAAVAILLAAVVTEVHFRLFTASYFGLWALTTTAIFLGAFITLRVAALFPTAIPAAEHARPARERQSRPRRDADAERPAN
ncbi:MAG: hypothetical protein HC809_05790, partial [Gammaproteobacteria bacterium]|nr:hypothetical protein [Gammaproteobacteria bacterium]